MDNGGLYFQRQAAQQVGEDDLGELSSNQLGNIVEQQVAVDVAERKGYDVLYTDDGANGIDMIARDGEDIVIIESKYSGSDDRVTAGDFKSKRQGAKQMTDEWVQTAFTGELQAIREQVDAGTLAEIDDAISDGDYRKEAVSVTPHSSEKLIGNSPELSDRIDELNIVKLGGTRGLTEE
jgi:Holliday junction resolvase-like predicted endonuclease